jgi:cell division septation protein DedD
LQYVDTKGCVFLRAGTEAETIWVPRVTAGGKQLCGYPPSGQRVPVAGETGAGEGTFEAAPDAGADTKAAVASPAPGKEPADTSRFVVALGSFGFASNVEKAAAGAEALGYPAIKGKLKGGEQGLVTVFAGPFGSKADAEAARQKLRKAGFPDAILMAY